MRQLVHYYKEHKQFLDWTKKHNISNSNKLLIEINFPDDNQERLQTLLNDLNRDFSKAIIVGMQSFTSFSDHTVSDIKKDPIISIMEFESSTISSEVLDLSINYVKGEIPLLDTTKVEKHLKSDTKALQILSSYNEKTTSEYINDIGAIFGHLKVYGGGATHSTQKKQAFIFHKNIIYNKAVVLIFMHGENLNVDLYQAFDWKPISKKKKITKIEDNSIVTIDDTKALDIYKKHFPNIEEDTSVSIQVPLYITKNNISYTAHILDIDFENQTLKVAQKLKEGDIVQLSIGNYNAMMNRVKEINNFLTETPAQGLWMASSISYEYGFRIPIIHYISTIKSNNHIFGYSTTQEYFNTENQPNTYHNHTFIMATISESTSDYIELTTEFNDKNIGPFVSANKNLYSIMHRTANELNQLTENLENMVNQRTKELNTLNEELQVKIKDAVRKEKRQNAIMNQQSRLASMGEILENIAHQWRQPLNTVSWIMNDTLIKAQLGKGDEIDLEELAKKVNNSIQFLSETIEDFRRFVDHSDMAQTFNVKKTIESTISLIKETLVRSDISIELDCPDDVKYKGFENDFKHVIMNLINNARDAFEERKIKNGHISIRVYHKKDELIIAVQDNAGGISKPILKNIFEPYFTTKHKTKGTGLGLYMSKNLIQKVKGNLEAFSILNQKTTFIITLPDEGAVPTPPPSLSDEEEEDEAKN